MMSNAAATLARLWTRAYTFGLPADVRARRCAEIDSDIWESLHDTDLATPRILPRLAAGVVDDVRWRAMQMPEETRTTALALTATCLSLVAIWVWVARPAAIALLTGSTWVYPLVESMHLLGAVSFVGLTLMLDFRLLGLTLRRVPVSELVSRVLPWAMPGAVLTLVSGMLAFIAESDRVAANVFFRIKAVALVLAVINLLVFHWASYSRVSDWDSGTPPTAARFSACVSLALWMVIFVASRLIAFG